MKEPISRRSFDPRRDYLGVYLDEGAPFVDSTWNEAADIHTALLVALTEAAGVMGSRGRELSIEPVLNKHNELTNLVIHGGPGPFYCGGMPVLFPEDRLIDAQRLDRSWFVDDTPRPASGSWLKALTLGDPYIIYVRAQTELVDDLDVPDLDDPGLEPERGSFRTAVVADIRLRRDEAPQVERTNLRLTVEGAYTDEVNALYWVELMELARDASSASLLWDDANASVVALVTNRVKKGGTQIPLSRTEGFAPGNFVRFEGDGVEGTLYEVVSTDKSNITIARHECNLVPISLSSYQVASIRNLPHGRVEVAFFDDFGSKGPGARINRGDVVTGLLTSPDPTSASIIYLVENKDSIDNTSLFTLTPTGLGEPLDPWYDDHRATRLTHDAHAFKYCVETDKRAMWSEGMSVRFSKGDTGREQEAEDRTITRIAWHKHTMTVRLDQPLSYPHKLGARVVPQRLIKARRYAGHVCRAAIAKIDPSHPGGLDLPGEGVKLPCGLYLHLSLEPEDGKDVPPIVIPGDGWSFAVRANGWVETRVFASVESSPEGVVPLAKFQLEPDGSFLLEDCRPGTKTRGLRPSAGQLPPLPPPTPPPPPPPPPPPDEAIQYEPPPPSSEEEP